jgi:hypothetical protein
VREEIGHVHPHVAVVRVRDQSDFVAAPPTKPIKLTPNSAFRSIYGTVPAAGASAQAFAVIAVWCS